MKKFIVITMLLVFVGVSFGQLTIHSRPDANWWSGHLSKDIAWRWAKTTDGLVNAGLSLGTGQIFYVDSNVTTEGNGNSWGTAKDTIDEGMNLCSSGDLLLVAQSHAETLAAAGNLVTCDVAGVTIIGMGSGTLRPSITLSHASAIAFNVDAANVTIENIFIDATGADSVNTPIDVGAVRCTINGIEMLMADGTGQADLGITTSGAANAADYMTIMNSRFISPDAGAVTAIDLEEVEEGVVISGCYIYGAFTSAGIHNITGKVLTNLLIKKCIVKNDDAGEHAIELVSACTGFLVENYYHTDTAATLVDPGSCFSFECYGIDDVDESAFVRPAVGTP